MDCICPICLQKIKNQAILDCCKHTFCKRCIFAWMKRVEACPLCKQHVEVIIADIISPSQYSQYLPNGSLLYKNYNPQRKVIYSLQLEAVPNYEGSASPCDVDKCPILKEWMQREIETLLPDMDCDFICKLLLEGLHRFGTQHEIVRKRTEEFLGDFASIFIREVENCINSKAKSIDEFDSIITYVYPSLAEKQDKDESIPNEDSLTDSDYQKYYNSKVKEYDNINEELEILLRNNPDLEREVQERENKLNQNTWKEVKFKNEPKESIPYDKDDTYKHMDENALDYLDWDRYDY